jgi:hypothetical protein
MNEPNDLPDLKEVLTGDLLVPGHWVVASLTMENFWPTKVQKLNWRGADFWIIPTTKGSHPAIATRVPSPTGREERETLLMRFISMLSWVEETGIRLEGRGLGGGNLPRPLGRPEARVFQMRRDAFDLPYFPEVTDERALRALALVREGRSLNHAGYAFLSFFKVLESAFPDGRKRGAWVTAAIPTLNAFGVNEALGHIHAQGATTPQEVSDHLFLSGRCAIAHASTTPVLDPDNPRDLRRLGSELPIIQALAVQAIEETFGVETRGTNFRKHLYELAGFKTIIGPDIISQVLNGASQEDEQIVSMPEISVGIRNHDPYEPLEKLRLKHASYNNGLMYLIFNSPLEDIEFQFTLDFNAERLGFDVFNELVVLDLGSAESAERIHAAKQFYQDYFRNGQLQILRAESRELISRKDPFLPINLVFDPVGAAAELNYWRQTAESRRHRDQTYFDQIKRYALRYDANTNTRMLTSL